MTKLRGYKFRIYPTDEQKEILSLWFGGCRFVYNSALELRIEAYRKLGISFSSFDLSKQLTEAKSDPMLIWLRDVPADTLNQELSYLETAYSNFFRRVKQGHGSGFPRFKIKHEKQSCYLRVARKEPVIKFDFKDTDRPGFGKIWINKKIGWIKTVIHTQPDGELRPSATISKEKSGKYFISLLYEDSQTMANPPLNPGLHIGLDMGINTFVTTSEGEKLNLSTDKTKTANRQRRLQRDLSRKQKGSQNFKDQKTKLAKFSEHIASKREQDHYNIIEYLLSKNPASIFVEGLRIGNMSKSAKGSKEDPGKNVKAKSGLNREILSMGWGGFLMKLELKCQEKGVYYHKIDSFYASSQNCSNCGHKHKPVKTKGLRSWVCPNCNSEHDRDINAAINIRNKGLEEVKQSTEVHADDSKKRLRRVGQESFDSSRPSKQQVLTMCD